MGSGGGDREPADRRHAGRRSRDGCDAPWASRARRMGRPRRPRGEQSPGQRQNGPQRSLKRTFAYHAEHHMAITLASASACSGRWNGAGLSGCSHVGSAVPFRGPFRSTPPPCRPATVRGGGDGAQALGAGLRRVGATARVRLPLHVPSRVPRSPRSGSVCGRGRRGGSQARRCTWRARRKVARAATPWLGRSRDSPGCDGTPSRPC